MIKNRFIQLFSRLIILGIMIYSFTISIKNPNWYVYYTNLSNYFCLVVVLIEIIFNIINLSIRSTVSTKEFCPAIKFCALIGITVTFLVLNILLDSPFRAEYWSFQENVLMHFVNPILFWLDYILFAEHNNTKALYPIYSIIFPLLYLAFIFIRSNFIKAGEGVIVYPYFFIDVKTLGVPKVIMWIAILVAVFVVLGYIIYIFDNIKNWKNKKKTFEKDLQ